MEIDHLIIGDGISGLLLLHRLLEEDTGSVLLISPSNRDARFVSGLDKYADSQTFWSQGILHRGFKYLLEPKTKIRPNFDKYVLQFERVISQLVDLDDFTLAERVQVIGDADSKLPRAAKGITVAGHAAGEWNRAKIGFFEEKVIDSWNLLRVLRLLFRDNILHTNITKIEHDYSFVKQVMFTDGIRIEPQRVYLCAGINNEKIWRDGMGMPKPKIQQTRPLLVGTVIDKALFPLYAHIVVDNKWQMTVTSMQDAIGRVQWRLGGPLFDADNSLSDIHDTTSKIFEKFFNVSSTAIAFNRVNRAELNRRGKRVLRPGATVLGNVRIGWPTKMMMAPALVEQLVE